MTTGALVATVGGLAWLSSPMWQAQARAAGVPVPAIPPPHLSDEHAAVCGALAAPILGVPRTTLRAKWFTLDRWAELKTWGIAHRGFRIITPPGSVFGFAREFVTFTADDYRAIFNAFTAAVRAGYGEDITAPLGVTVRRVPEGVGEALARINALGIRVFFDQAQGGGELGDQAHIDCDAAIVKLCVELDAAGTVDPGPTVGGSLAAGVAQLPETLTGAADWAGGLAIDLLGGALGGIASTLIRSKVFWLGAFGVVAWKVLR